jgi:hypothetical protein
MELFVDGIYCHPLKTKSILVSVDRGCGLLVIGFIGMKTPGALEKGLFTQLDIITA